MLIANSCLITAVVSLLELREAYHCIDFIMLYQMDSWLKGAEMKFMYRCGTEIERRDLLFIPIPSALYL